MRSALPSEVAAFITASLGSIDELYVLLLCVRARERWLDAAAVSREVGVTVAVARSALENLTRRNLLDVRVTDDLRYQFNPGTTELELGARLMCEAYERHPLAVTQFVTDRAQRVIRDFADAFRIRRDDHR